MILDKLAFLERAIRITAEEVKEEAELIKEGVSSKDSAELIISMMNDLLDSLENLDSLAQLEEEEITESSPILEEYSGTFDFVKDDPISSSFPFSFENGEKVFVKGEGYIPSIGIKECFGFARFDSFPSSDKIQVGKHAWIVGRRRKRIGRTSTIITVYLIDQNRNLFFIDENNLSG